MIYLKIHTYLVNIIKNDKEALLLRITCTYIMLNHNLLCTFQLIYRINGIILLLVHACINLLFVPCKLLLCNFVTK